MPASKQIIEELVNLLGGYCALCNGQYPGKTKAERKKTWTIHHRRYRDGEKSSNDFKEKVPHIITRGKNRGKKTTRIIYHRLEYYTYLRPLVYDHPTDFAPLHNSCHQSVTRGARWGKATGNRARYCELIMEME